MQAADLVTFGGGGLDRDAQNRQKAPALRQLPSARSLPLWRGRPLVEGGAGRLVLLDPAHPAITAHGGQWLYLGMHDDAPLFADDLSGWAPDGADSADPGPGRSGPDIPAKALPGIPKGARFADLRALITGLDALDAELAVTAKGMLEWHRTHGFCAACGAPSETGEGGWQRSCIGCGRRHFPRTDPVVIMLVTDGNNLLVGRSSGWPEGFYSLLAGFMEPGETVAMAVRREVAEETGVRVGAVRMLASQPWPFPASLMIGCAATAASTEITLDPAELDDALWLSREEMLEVFSGRHGVITTPRRGAIAHFLIQMWLADRVD